MWESAATNLYLNVKVSLVGELRTGNHHAAIDLSTNLAYMLIASQIL